ncbi:MAG: hypothetical protein DRO13_04750 [Thermoprotei archaeon]|nr:MAG: hypothetical protein DRO13_04750 [Thermoprotei archaeon]
MIARVIRARFENGVLKPLEELGLMDVYEREVETHRKSRLLIRLLKEKRIEVLNIPLNPGLRPATS